MAYKLNFKCFKNNKILIICLTNYSYKTDKYSSQGKGWLAYEPHLSQWEIIAGWKTNLPLGCVKQSVFPAAWPEVQLMAQGPDK